MSASRLLVLKPGENVDENGVQFQIQPSVPALVEATTSTQSGFLWQWLAIARIFESASGTSRQYDSGALIGIHGGILHVVALPESPDGNFLYQSVKLADASVTAKMKKPLFGKPRLAMVAVKPSGQFGVVSEAANRLDASGATDGVDRLAEFGQAVGAGA